MNVVCCAGVRLRCEARGGRGGWLGKLARRCVVTFSSFTPNECLLHLRPSRTICVLSHNSSRRDIPARYLLRLGMGERDLDVGDDFSRAGRVNNMLARRLTLLAEVRFVCLCTSGFSMVVIK